MKRIWYLIAFLGIYILVCRRPVSEAFREVKGAALQAFNRERSSNVKKLLLLTEPEEVLVRSLDGLFVRNVPIAELQERIAEKYNRDLLISRLLAETNLEQTLRDLKGGRPLTESI